MAIRHAALGDLPQIVSIYNASIPGRMATADLAPVSVAERRQWFAEFDPRRRPLFVS
jgi:phosphinothricin acetyltransferase